MKLLSYLRVGISAGLIGTVTLDTINGLMYDVQPAAVMTAAREDMDAAARDAARATMVRDTLI